MVEQMECVVVGAGAVGLAVARALSLAGREVLLVESAETIGTGTSSRNSEVIHAGLYYPPGSLKAQLCRRGRDLLYAHLKEHRVDHRRVGKLVVATCTDEDAQLDAIAARAEANGVEDLVRLTGAEARAMEPELHCRAALLSPSTGIFDSHGYMLSLWGAAAATGALCAFHASVTGGWVSDDGIYLEIGGDQPMTLLAKTVVNAAGLGAMAVASAIRGLKPEHVPPLYYAKGSYFSLAGRPPFQRLVYPVPDQASVGLHYTCDLSGRGRFGPDVEWVDQVDYSVDGTRAILFYDSIRRYWPDLQDGALTADYAGVRPKLQSPTEPPKDFLIQGPTVHGVPGLINLFGIESPGLTSSLAIAELVAEMLGAD